MALDRKTFTSPPSNTTFAFTQIETNEEIVALWQGVTLPLTLTNALPNALTAVAYPPMTAYGETRRFTVTTTQANTGPMTLSIDNLAALPMVTAGNTAITAGMVGPGAMLDVVYDSSINAFRVMGGLGQVNAIPSPTQQWQVLQADASLNWVPSQQLFSGAF